MDMEETECSGTSAYKIQTPGNYPEERIQYSEHGLSLKSRMLLLPFVITVHFKTRPIEECPLSQVFCIYLIEAIIKPFMFTGRRRLPLTVVSRFVG
jgi:hypothetical protein